MIDSLGYEVGDNLICEVFEWLWFCMWIGDMVGCSGGDEFIVLVDDMDDLFDVVCVVECIWCYLLKFFLIDG